MADYVALATAWAALAAGTIDEKLAALNAQTVAGATRDVDVGEVEGYLSMSGKLAIIEAWQAANPVTMAAAPTAAQIAARELLRTIESPHVTRFQTSTSTVYAQLQAMLQALQAAALITADDVMALLGLAATVQPWWRAHGFEQPIGSADLSLAGLA